LADAFARRKFFGKTLEKPLLTRLASRGAAITTLATLVWFLEETGQAGVRFPHFATRWLKLRGIVRPARIGLPTAARILHFLSWQQRAIPISTILFTKRRILFSPRTARSA
jgi:hypothetical protein